MNTEDVVRVLIASWLEPEHVERIAALDRRVEVLFEPELLPVPRYPADHHGPARALTRSQLDHWKSLLAAADVSLDFDWYAPAEMAANCPNLRWLQATSSGIGQFLDRTGLNRTDVTFTTAAGIHAIPLAEFALTGILYFIKQLPDLADWQQSRRWERYTARQLAGRRALVVGLGHVGRKVADVLTALGVEVWAAVRDLQKVEVRPGVTAIETDAVNRILPQIDAVVLCCPLTPQTEGFLNETRIRLLPRGAIIVNIARGPIITEPALISALADGHLGGACLDVATVEPLPTQSPLWTMRNVIISPHSASTVDCENSLITDLFCENLRRYLDGQNLINLYSAAKGY